MQGNPVKLIVGLGNPGPQYRFHRHNAGAWFLEQLCQDYQGDLRPDSKFFGAVGRVTIAASDVRLLFPLTFMNKSGQSVAALCQYFDIAPENILVAYDEIDFEVGTTRLKQGGGHGGHNGIRDIINALGGSRDFYRLRIGVGHPGDRSQVSNYVLSEPPKSEAENIHANIDDALRVVPQIVSGQWQNAVHELHTNAD